ncbi:MAG TPA: helix-turn-helix domain-containing protein [Candidatus Binatia bacterium]|nr:helix-turn-helix domain-containing protein [Candidatus Binatia bacterium]
MDAQDVAAHAGEWEMMVKEEMSGDEIRNLRKKLGLTQEEFAHAVAVTFSTVNRWENGHAKPSKLARRAIEALMSPKGASNSGSQSIDELASGAFGAVHTK